MCDRLQEQAAELLRASATLERPAVPRSGGGTIGSGSRLANEAEAIGRANYTASGLGAFTLPLMASSGAGLTPDAIASIEDATVTTITNATSVRLAACAASEAAVGAPTSAPAPDPT